MNIRCVLLGLVCTLGSVTSKSLIWVSQPPEDYSNTITSMRRKFPKSYDPAEIYDLHVDTNVTNRYARTLISSKLRNAANVSQSISFSAVIPDNAYISGFMMEINGIKYAAHVEEQTKAKKTYRKAVKQGQAAAHVTRDSYRFTVSVNMEPEAKAKFYLTYEELLERKNEKYELILNLHPGQPVNLNVQVRITESRPLKFVKVPDFRTGNGVGETGVSASPYAIVKYEVKYVSNSSATVTFSPSEEEQKILAGYLGTDREHGFQGQFVVQYDVERDPLDGEILIDGNYFVHYYAPTTLASLKRQVIIVQDTSRSVTAPKVVQLDKAMRHILDELKSEDTLSLITFSNNVFVYDIVSKRAVRVRKNSTESQISKSVAASPENIEKLKDISDGLVKEGRSTKIYRALEVALEVTKNGGDGDRQPIIYVLTGGEHEIGHPSDEKVISKITEMNTRKVPIHILSMGSKGTDREFLKELSLKNQGYACHISDPSNVPSQVENFFQKISPPLLLNVTFNYGDQTKNVTRTIFPVLYYGEELVVVGVLDDSKLDIAEVVARSTQGTLIGNSKIHPAAQSLQRLWAYLSVKQYLEEAHITGNYQKAVELSMEYSFVTDVTSLVVVKPDASVIADIQHAAEDLYEQSKHQYTPVASKIGKKGFRVPSRKYIVSPIVFEVTENVPYHNDYWLDNEGVDVINNSNDYDDEDPPSWLEEKSNITIDSKTFSLSGQTKEVHDKPCQNGFGHKNGTCRLIFDCPTMFSELVDLNALKTYFCEVTPTVAGVCCVAPLPVSTSSTASITTTLTTSSTTTAVPTVPSEPTI